MKNLRKYHYYVKKKNKSYFSYINFKKEVGSHIQFLMFMIIIVNFIFIMIIIVLSLKIFLMMLKLYKLQHYWCQKYYLLIFKNYFEWLNIATKVEFFKALLMYQKINRYYYCFMLQCKMMCYLNQLGYYDCTHLSILKIKKIILFLQCIFNFFKPYNKYYCFHIFQQQMELHHYRHEIWEECNFISFSL